MNNKLCNNFFNLTRKKVKKIHVVVSLILVLSMFAGTVEAFAESSHIVRMNIDDKWHVYKTMEKTVGEFLKKENIILNKKDIIDTPLDKKITEDIYINLNTAETITLIDGNKQFRYITNEPNIGKAIEEFSKEQKKEYFLDDNKSSISKIKDGMKIKVSSYVDKIQVMTESIPFETKTIQNTNLYEGTKNITTKGANGIKEIKLRNTYKKDEIIDKNIISIQTITEPTTEIIEIGTKKKEVPKPPVKTVKTEKGTFEYSKKIPMKSTAYTAGVESTGKRPGQKGYGITASGMKAREGVVAVDTRIIPFGTKLFIEGYGYAIAGDTGSAIKGNKIDVFFDDYSDAIQYGVKNVDVYILDEQVL